MASLEEVTDYTLDEADRERLFALQRVCSVCWSTQDGWPVGVTHRYVWARERGVGRMWEPRFLALLGIAQLELEDPKAGRAAAQDGVVFMRESHSIWNPHSYAVLARAQLELAEPAADISVTLDEYEALLMRTGFHIYEGELHELRAQLAEREGQHVQRAAALARAHDCYSRFGMMVQATRVADAAASAV